MKKREKGRKLEAYRVLWLFNKFTQGFMPKYWVSMVASTSIKWIIRIISTEKFSLALGQIFGNFYHMNTGKVFDLLNIVSKFQLFLWPW